MSLTNEQESPLNRTQKNWTQPVFVRTTQDLISRMDDKRSKIFNAHQGKFGSQTKSAGRFSRHATLKSLIKQTLGSIDLPSMLEPRGLYRTDGKRTDGVTMIPWERGEQLAWNVTDMDALIPSRLNQGSLCNQGTTGTEAEARKIEKYRELIDNGYIF